MVVFGVIALLAALRFRSIIKVYEFGATIYASAIFFPFILSLFWKRTKFQAVIAGMIIGSVTALLVSTLDWSVDGVILGNFASLVTTIFLSLVIKNKSNQKILALYGLGF